MCLAILCRSSVQGRPGGDLLSRGLSRSTIGAGGFHFRVRDGIGWIFPRHSHQAVLEQKDDLDEARCSLRDCIVYRVRIFQCNWGTCFKFSLILRRLKVSAGSAISVVGSYRYMR